MTEELSTGTQAMADEQSSPQNESVQDMVDDDPVAGDEELDHVDVILIAPFEHSERRKFDTFRKAYIDPAIETVSMALDKQIDVVVLNPLVSGKGLSDEKAYRALHQAALVIADVTNCDHRAISFFTMRQSLCPGPAIPFTRDRDRISFPTNIDPYVINATNEENSQNARGVFQSELKAAMMEGQGRSRYMSHVFASLRALKTNLRGSKRKKDLPPTYENYRLIRSEHECEAYGEGPLFAMAAGDIRKVMDTDVWVNPENTHMEMARVFDTSVSGTIRHLGANWFTEGERSDDFIRRKLAESMKTDTVLPGDAIITDTAGELKKSNNVKKVVHVAAVQLRDDDPGCGYDTVEDVGLCVTNALELIDQKNKGVLGVGSNQLQSVLFPLLGVGASPSEAYDNVLKMLRAGVRYFRAHPKSGVRRFSLLAYSEEDRRLILKAVRHLKSDLKADDGGA